MKTAVDKVGRGKLRTVNARFEAPSPTRNRVNQPPCGHRSRADAACSYPVRRGPITLVYREEMILRPQLR